MLSTAQELATIQRFRGIITELSVAMSEEVPREQRESALMRASSAAELLDNESDRHLVEELISRAKDLIESHSKGRAIWPIGNAAR